MRTLSFLTAAVALSLTACLREAPTPSTPALRHVQTTLRNELRQRWLRVDQPSPDTLRLTFQDEGFRKSPAQLGTYATAAAHRALGVLAPPPSTPPAALRVVSVRIAHSRRLGPLSWLSHVSTYNISVPDASDGQSAPEPIPPKSPV